MLATGKLACHDETVKFLLSALIRLLIVLAFTGCLNTSVGGSGGPGSVTVTNTNAYAMIAAAQDVFAQAGYSSGTVVYPTSISFEKRASRFGEVMWGSYNQTTAMRVRLFMTPIPGTNNYRLSTRVFAVNNAGEAGFEDQRPLIGLWSGEFGSLLRKIKTQASGVGPGP